MGAWHASKWSPEIALIFSLFLQGRRDWHTKSWLLPTLAVQQNPGSRLESRAEGPEGAWGLTSDTQLALLFHSKTWVSARARCSGLRKPQCSWIPCVSLPSLEGKSYSLPAFSERWSSPMQTIASLFNVHHLAVLMCLTPRCSGKPRFPQEIFLHAGCVQVDLFIELFPLNCLCLSHLQPSWKCKHWATAKGDKLFLPWPEFRNIGNLARVLFLLGFPVWLVDQRSLDTHLNS